MEDWRAVALAIAAVPVLVVLALGLGWSERPGSWLVPVLAAGAVAAAAGGSAWLLRAAGAW